MIRKEVQDTINAARKTYNEGLLKPARGTYHSNGYACLIGAASRQFTDDLSSLGSSICMEKFKLTRDEIGSIVAGFDSTLLKHSDSEVRQAARDFAIEMGLD